MFGPEFRTKVFFFVFGSLFEFICVLLSIRVILPEKVPYPDKLFVQHPDIDVPAPVKSGCFQGKAALIIDPVDETEKSVKINMSASDRQNFQVAPVHISPAVVIDVVMPDMVFRMEPFIFRIV